MAQLAPHVGAWYKDVQLGSIFEVVAVDDSDQTVETQYVDGEIGEFDLDTWGDLLLEPAAEPEDWRKPFEIGDEIDSDAASIRRDWSEAINQIEPEINIDLGEA